MKTYKETFLLFSLLIFSPLLALSSGPPFSCDPSDPKTLQYAFCKTTLPTEQRVKDLVSQMTLQEKISQLGDDGPAIPRLGIPAFKWWTEALHGMAYGGTGSIRFSFSEIYKATSFPQVIVTGASFNPQLWYKIGEVGFQRSYSLSITYHIHNINLKIGHCKKRGKN
jgi:hypothetical protein